MSQSALFVLVRGGDRRYYYDPLGFRYLYRDLVWGPQAFEDWAIEADEIDEFAPDADGGAVVDFDARMLVWSGARDAMVCPAVADVYQRLLDHAWPHFQVEFAARGMADLAIAADVPDADEFPFESEPRFQSIDECHGVTNDGHCAWITLVDEQGDVYQVELLQVSDDLMDADPDLVQTIRRSPTSNVPPQATVIEGMWIDVPHREVGVWGSPGFRLHFDAIESNWQGWTVRRDDVGYHDQCNVGGQIGMPLSDAKAVGMIAPMILSSQRIKRVNMIEKIGAEIRSAAIRLTGCLTMVLISPIILFALVSGDWRSAGVVIAAVLVIVVAIFHWIERKVRRRFKANVSQLPIDLPTNPQRPDAAGPSDPVQRRDRFNVLLAEAGLPPMVDAI